jgi:glycosidase
MRILALLALPWLPWLAAACAAPRPAAPTAPDTTPVDAAPTPPPLDGAASAPADWRAQVLYLVIPDRFRNGDPSNDAAAPGCFDPTAPQKLHGGDFAGLAAHLDYLTGLGATAVWITPPNLQIGPQAASGGSGSGGTACGYHGYWIDYTDPPDDALAPNLGTPDQLASLVDAMHAAGLRFVLDMVVNHTGNTARLPAQHPTWFHDPATCAQLGSPDVYCPLDHHPDFAQEQPEVAAYLSALEARAAARYHIDGIRMDTAKHVPPSYFHTSFFPAVRAVNPAVFSIAEIFDESGTAPMVPYLDAGFDSAFHYPLYGALVSGIAQGGSVDVVANAVADGISRLGLSRALDLVLFVDNHDVPRFANLPGYGVPAGRVDLIPGEDEIRRRLLLGLDLIFTLPGIPQLYYGDELGMYGGADPDNRRDLPAWAMDPAARAQPHPGEAIAGSDLVFARVKLLAHLRTTDAALATGAYHELWRQNGAANPNVYAFERGAGDDELVVVIGNGARATGTVHIPAHDLPDGTVLTDELGDGAPAQLAITGGALAVDLPARSAAIYRVTRP